MPSFEFPSMPDSEQMSPSQLLTIISLERTGGCISLVAVLLIFVAYWLVREVRNVQNTFIVFASVANVGASIASIISMDGLMKGKESTLCQAQSFMFEMFMQSDPWWSLAMAINVFLVFYLRVSPDSFQQWWWLYCLICYGGPFVIALALLLVRHPDRGLVYGEATIWCWVDREWDAIRIYTYYLLIWICIAGSLILYFLVGYHVFRSRNQLRSFSTTSKGREVTHIEEGPKIELPDGTQESFYGTVVTEVHIEHSSPSSSEAPSEPQKAHLPSVSFDTEHEDREPQQHLTGQCFSTVTSIPMEPFRKPSSHRQKHRLYCGLFKTRPPGSSGLDRIVRGTRSILSKFVVADPVKRAYLRTSFLFALSVLATWIPSSMNRIHSWMTGESPFGYHVSTAAVLPLQGLWNAVIFFVTSSDALKRGWVNWREPGAERVGIAEDEGGVEGRSGIVGDSRDMVRDESDDGEIDTMGSDVELRRMAEAPGKSSASLS